MKKNVGIIVLIVILVVILVGGIIIYFSGNKNTDTQTQQTTETKNVEKSINEQQPEAETKAPENTESATNANGLKIEVLKEGTGTKVTKAGDGISVNYLGTLENGTKFDSSYDRNQPFKFDLGAGQVIKGWDQGLIGMKIGEKRKLTIPPTLGYGSQAMGTKIPANSTLIFEVELLEIL